MNDTIAAISTTMGVGAISIIRVSGDDSIDIVNKIFKGKNLNKVESHTINYGHIIENKNIIDEVSEIADEYQRELEEEIIETGKRTAIDLGIHGLHPDLIRLVGKMKYRLPISQKKQI